MKTLIALACCLLVWSQTAFGHADLTAISPAVGAVLPDVSATRNAAIWLTRWLTYLCLFTVSGAALFRLRARDSELRWARVPVLLGLVLLLVDLALQGLARLGGSWTALFGLAPWRAALSNFDALTLGLMVLALLAGLAALKARRLGALWLWAVASALLPGIAVALGVHGNVAVPWWLGRPLVVLHVLMAITWVGTLVPLYRMLRPSAVAASVPTRRTGGVPALQAGKSAWPLLAMVLLTVSGLGLAIPLLRHPADLVHTDRGNVLLALLIVGAALLFVAVRNRWRWVMLDRSESPQWRSHLRRGLGTEIILAMGVLSIASLWRFAPLPSGASTGIEAPQGPVVALENHQIRALIELPLQDVGPWRIRLIAINGGVLAPQGVTLTLSNPALGLDPVTRLALRQPDGRWLVDVPALPVGGQWHVGVELLMGDFDQIALQRDLMLPTHLASPVTVPAQAAHRP